MSDKNLDKCHHKLSDEAIKDLLNDWSRNRKLVPTNFANEIDITKKRDMKLFLITLKVEYESRTKGPKSDPYTGGNIDNEGEPPDIWNLKSKLVNKIIKEKKFADDIELIKVPHTESVDICYKCKGEGVYVCPKCKGAGFISCKYCRGTGKSVCLDCGGSGLKECHWCGGKGYKIDSKGRQLICNHCNGRGSTPCKTCNGTGMVACTMCSGTGRVTCNRCGGAGRVECHVCLGAGKLKNYVVAGVVLSCYSIQKYYTNDLPNNLMEKIFETYSENIPSSEGHVIFLDFRVNREYAQEETETFSGDFNQILEKYRDTSEISSIFNVIKDIIEKETQFRLSLEDRVIMETSRALYNTEGLRVAAAYADDPDAVRSIVEKYVYEMSKSVDYIGTKRVLYSLVVYCFPVLEVEYVYHDKSYVVWIFGNSMAILTEKAPNIVSDKLSGFGKKLKGFLKRRRKE